MKKIDKFTVFLFEQRKKIQDILKQKINYYKKVLK